MSIESPYEIFDIGDGGVVTTKILKWELGEMTIKTRVVVGQKVVKVLRIFVPPETKPIFPDYYDITSTTLIAQLVPFLQQADFINKKYKITKVGVAPQARFTLEVSPAI